MGNTAQSIKWSPQPHFIDAAPSRHSGPHSLITPCFPVPCWQAVHPDIQSQGNLHQSFLISVLSTRCAETGKPMWWPKYVTTSHKIYKSAVGTQDMLTFLIWKLCSFVLQWHIVRCHLIYIIPINFQLPDCRWIKNQIPHKRFRQ